MIGFLLAPDASVDDCQKYFNALQKAQRDIDGRIAMPAALCVLEARPQELRDAIVVTELATNLVFREGFEKYRANQFDTALDYFAAAKALAPAGRSLTGHAGSLPLQSWSIVSPQTSFAPG